METIETDDIDKSSSDEKVKRRNFFNEWKNREGSGTTYGKLLSALLAIKCRDDAESVCEMLQVYTINHSVCRLKIKAMQRK